MPTKALAIVVSIIFTAGASVYLLGALWGACAFPLYGIAVAPAAAETPQLGTAQESGDAR